MKVIKQGDTIKKRSYKFKCDKCGCKYVADHTEWTYCYKYGDITTNQTDYVSCECPECHKINQIHLRGRFWDWYDKYHNPLLIITTLLGVLLFFVFIGIEHYIIALISLLISTILFGIILEI